MAWTVIAAAVVVVTEHLHMCGQSSVLVDLLVNAGNAV